LPDGDSGSQGRKTRRVAVEVGHFRALDPRSGRVRENAAADDLTLDASTLAEIDGILAA